jgi:hypothetical protein
LAPVAGTTIYSCVYGTIQCHNTQTTSQNKVSLGGLL